MRVTALAVLLFAGTALAAPPTSPGSRDDPEFGATVMANARAQVVDMNPHYAGRIIEGTSGHRNGDAVLRYEKGQLKPLLKTNGDPDVGGQGGAGDGPAPPVTPLTGGGTGGTGGPN